MPCKMARNGVSPLTCFLIVRLALWAGPTGAQLLMSSPQGQGLGSQTMLACPVIQPTENFNINQIDGLWYQVIRSNNVAARTRVCTTIEIDSKSKILKDQGHNLATAQTEIAQYELTPIHDARPPAFKISLPGNHEQYCDWQVGAFKSNEWVALYCCPNSPNNANQYKAMVLSKSRDVSLRSTQIAVGALETGGLRFTPEVVWHGDCERYSATLGQQPRQQG